MNMHIGVAGNIGSGKTTLTRLLSKHYNWEAHYEDVDDNPYLNDFYEEWMPFFLAIPPPTVPRLHLPVRIVRWSGDHAHLMALPGKVGGQFPGIFAGTDRLRVEVET